MALNVDLDLERTRQLNRQRTASIGIGYQQRNKPLSFLHWVQKMFYAGPKTTGSKLEYTHGFMGSGNYQISIKKDETNPTKNLEQFYDKYREGIQKGEKICVDEKLSDPYSLFFQDIDVISSQPITNQAMFDICSGSVKYVSECFTKLVDQEPKDVENISFQQASTFHPKIGEWICLGGGRNRLKCLVSLPVERDEKDGENVGLISRQDENGNIYYKHGAHLNYPGRLHVTSEQAILINQHCVQRMTEIEGPRDATKGENSWDTVYDSNIYTQGGGGVRMLESWKATRCRKCNKDGSKVKPLDTINDDGTVTPSTDVWKCTKCEWGWNYKKRQYIPFCVMNFKGHIIASPSFETTQKIQIYADDDNPDGEYSKLLEWLLTEPKVYLRAACLRTFAKKVESALNPDIIEKANVLRKTKNKVSVSATKTIFNIQRDQNSKVTWKRKVLNDDKEFVKELPEAKYNLFTLLKAVEKVMNDTDNNQYRLLYSTSTLKVTITGSSAFQINWPDNDDFNKSCWVELEFGQFYGNNSIQHESQNQVTSEVATYVNQKRNDTNSDLVEEGLLAVGQSYYLGARNGQLQGREPRTICLHISRLNINWTDIRFSSIKREKENRYVVETDALTDAANYCLNKNGKHKSSKIRFIIIPSGFIQQCWSPHAPPGGKPCFTKGDAKHRFQSQRFPIEPKLREMLFFDIINTRPTEILKHYDQQVEALCHRYDNNTNTNVNNNVNNNTNNNNTNLNITSPDTNNNRIGNSQSDNDYRDPDYPLPSQSEAQPEHPLMMDKNNSISVYLARLLTAISASAPDLRERSYDITRNNLAPLPNNITAPLARTNSEIRVVNIIHTQPINNTSQTTESTKRKKPAAKPKAKKKSKKSQDNETQEADDDEGVEDFDDEEDFVRPVTAATKSSSIVTVNGITWGSKMKL